MPRTYRVPCGTQLTCKNWLIEAAYRMLQNNLDPDVAFDPDNLVVYGGRGRAAAQLGLLRRHPERRICSCRGQNGSNSLDNLRSVVIILVIVLHASFDLHDPRPNLVVCPGPGAQCALRLGRDPGRCTPHAGAFFLAGFFAFPSLERHGPGNFMRDKVARIGIPWVVGVLFLAPLVTYMIYVSRQVPVSYRQFWATDFWGPMYQQAVYWFLGVLFLFYALLSAGYSESTRLRAWRRVCARPRGGISSVLAHHDGGLLPAQPVVDARRLAPRVVDCLSAGAVPPLHRLLLPRSLCRPARLVCSRRIRARHRPMAAALFLVAGLLYAGPLGAAFGPSGGRYGIG